jgi:TPR repeat protein
MASVYKTINDFDIKYDVTIIVHKKSKTFLKKVANILKGKIDEKYVENSDLLPYIGAYYQCAMKNLEKAEEFYKLGMEKGNMTATNNLGMLYEKQGKNDLAMKHYKLAISKGDINGLQNLGDLYEKQGKTELAIKYYKSAIEKGNINALNSLGVVYGNQKNFDAAVELYHMAIKKGNMSAINNLGIAYENEGKFDLAIEYYKIAIEKGVIPAIGNLGSVYEKQNKLDLAIEYYLLGIQKNNNRSLIEIKKLMSELKLYYILSQLKDKSIYVTELMASLKNNKDVHCFNNKQNFNSKTDTCLICHDLTTVIPLNCAHFYCCECYTNITQCAICRF